MLLVYSSITLLLPSLSSHLLLVTSFHTGTPIVVHHHRRPLLSSSSSATTRLFVSSSSSSASRATTTSPATVNYLNSLQSITSNPQLFPATSDTIEALLLSSSQQKKQSSEEISPKDFLMNLSREVRMASKNNSGGGETMMMEEQSFDSAASLTNAAKENVATSFSPLSTKTAIASSNNNELANSASSSSSNNNRGVSGLRQAASKRINNEPLSSSSSSSYTSTTSTIQEDEVLSWDTAYTTTTNTKNDQEVQSSQEQQATTSSSKLLGVVPITNPNTPLLSTTIGLTTGVTSYNLIDEYAYQFNTWHNDQLLDLMDVQQEYVEQWDDLIGRYVVPLNEVESVVEDVVRGVEYLGREVVDGLESSFAAAAGSGGMIAAGSSVYEEVSTEGISPVEASVDESLATSSSSSPPLEANTGGGVEDASATTTISETATTPIQAVDSSETLSSSSSSSTAATAVSTPSVDEFAVDEGVITSTTTSSSSTIDVGNENNLLSDNIAEGNTPVEGTSTQYADASSSVDSIPEAPTLNAASLDSGVDQVDNSLSHVTSSMAAAESTQYSDVGVGSDDAWTSSVNEVTADGGSGPPPTSYDSSGVNLMADATTPTEHFEYPDFASSEVSSVDQGVLSSSSESANTKLLVDTTSSASVDLPKGHEATASPSLDAATIHESSQENLQAAASTSSSVDLSQHSEVISPSSLNEAVVNQDVNHLHESSQANLLADASTSSPLDPSHHSETLIDPSLNEVTGYDMTSVHDNDHANLWADASKSASVDLPQHSENIQPPPLNEANQGVASVPENSNPNLLADASGSAHEDLTQSFETILSPPSITESNTLEGGNADLLADATQSTPDAAVMHPDVPGTEALPHSSNDVTGIDQNVMHTPAPAYESGNFDVAESTHQQRWFTAPSSAEQHITSDKYTHTDYSANFDQSSYSSSVGFDSGSISQESFPSWHSQGSSNPLRDLAASLPPPVDRARGTGGDYYGGDVTSQWFQADELLSADLSNVPVAYHEEVMAQATDATNSFATQTSDEFTGQFFSGADQVESLDPVATSLDAVSQSLDSLHEVTSSSSASANDALVSAKAKLFGSLSNSLGDIQGEVNVGNVPHTPFDTHALDESTFTSIMHNAAETFQSIHPPAAVSSAIQHSSDASLADIGHGIMEAVKFLAGILLTVVDANLDLAAPGSSSSVVLQSVQSSVNTMLENASYTVANVINDVGNLSLKDIVHNLMVLMVATADMLMKVMNAVVYLLSGKDAGNWALQATSSVNEASSQLLAQADDVTHRSIGDLASSIGDYSYHVGNELVALLGSLNGAEGGHLDGSALDAITTAMQTGFTM